jgi:hypothetical protein
MSEIPLSQRDQLQNCPCTGGICAPQPFIFDNVQYQTAANTVYEHQVAYDIRKNARVTGKTYKFKTDYERMQALIGGYARNPTCGNRQ